MFSFFAFHDFCRILDYIVGSEFDQFPQCAENFLNGEDKLMDGK